MFQIKSFIMFSKFRKKHHSASKKTYQDWLKSVSEIPDYNKYIRPNWFSGFEKGNNQYDFSGITLEGVAVFNAFAEGLTIRNSVFKDVVFEEGDFSRANFSNCHFINTRFNKTIFTDASFEQATFENCNLNRVNLVNANFCVKAIEETVVYGISAWDLHTCNSSKQSKLVIEKTYSFYSDIIAEGRIPLMVDDIELAQFIYYLTNHKRLRETINVMNSRSVLLLGRFNNGGLERLYKLREWLLKQNYLPMIFDFERPDSMDLVEVIVTMGGLCKFIIADLSGPFVNTELTEISSLYFKPIILFHSNQPNRPDIKFETENNYIHRIHFDGSIEELLKKIQLKIQEINTVYSQFVQEASQRSEKKYIKGQDVSNN